jgi:transposase InsO family protein
VAGGIAPRSRPDLWPRCHPPIARHGHPGQPTAPASPWQNGFAERLIGSIRRECVDHIIVLGEVHLRRVLQSYADYYNSVRTGSLNKDAPVSRPVQRTGVIKSRAIWADFITATPVFKFSVHTSIAQFDISCQQD